MGLRTFGMVAAIFFLAFLSLVRGTCNQVEEQKVLVYLRNFESVISSRRNAFMKSKWNYVTNMTTANRQRMVQTEAMGSAAIGIAAGMIDSNIVLKLNCSADTLRQFYIVAPMNFSHYIPEAVTKLRSRKDYVIAHMTNLCKRAEVCSGGAPANCLPITPDVVDKMATSRDPDELLQLWEGWRDATGRQIRDNYTSLIHTEHELMKETYFWFSDKGLQWLEAYSGFNPGKIRQSLDDMMQQLMPLYRQLQVFARNRLESVYPRPNLFKPKLIPAHLLDNNLANDWSNLHQQLLPFPNKRAVDITAELRRKNYSVLQMFQTSNDLFTSMGMMAMTDEFWNNSMLEKPTDGRRMDCRPEAFDFADGKDYRIKMCATVSRDDFFTIIHKMGHVQHFMQYNHQPFMFRASPHQGFSEAIGDTLGLSAGTTSHLKTIGLMNARAVEDEQTDLNHLMSTALAKVPALSFNYLLDRYRRDLWSGLATTSNYTRHWWDLRCKYQGIVPPVERTEEDFDAGAYSPLPTNRPITRFFFGYILQFQLYEALCNATNHTGPLFKCDFYNSVEAGTKLSEMLKVGVTQNFAKLLLQLTGREEIDAGPMLRYFRPLMNHLESVNGDDLDWDDQCHAVLDTLIRPRAS